MRVLQPKTLDEALGMLAESSAPLTPAAGCTDLLVSWYHQTRDDLALLDLGRVTELQPFRLDEDRLELGGLTTYWDVMQSAEITAAFPLLREAARQVGAVQIQTRGTWAGNIGNGSPAADGVPVLMAYDAVVVLCNRDGCVEVPLDRYYTGYRQSVRQPDQLITAVHVPRRRYDHQWFYKVGARSAQAITKVGVAMVHGDAGWRIVVNSVAPVVLRCRALEAALDQGRRFTAPSEIRDLLERDIQPIDDIRSTAEYRTIVLSRLIYHWLQEHT